MPRGDGAGSQSDRLRDRQPEREKRGKGGACIDPPGYDAGKKIRGKKRHILVDTVGLLLHAVVHPADIQDRDGGVLLLSTLFGMYPFLAKLCRLNKSPVPLICQSGPGFNPITAPPEIVEPFMSQIEAEPSVFCHRISDVPVPKKLPVPLICQSGPGFNPIKPPPAIVWPFMSQIEGDPSLFCHRMSVSPAPKKSPRP